MTISRRYPTSQILTFQDPKPPRRLSVVSLAVSVPGVTIYSTLSLTVRSPEQALFQAMIIKCVVQLELIQAIDNIVFYPNVARQDDLAIMEFAQVL